MLVTGASSGLGAGIARLYLERGWDVALTARRVERLETLRDELAARPGAGRVRTAELDVRDVDRVAAVFTDVVDDLGGLDTVVVNAGVGKGATIGTGNVRAHLDTIVTNLVGAMAQCEAAMDLFYAQGHGHLVLMGSASSVRGQPGALNVYASTKSAIRSLGEGIRGDIRTAGKRREIHVSVIHPALIASEMTDRAGVTHRAMSAEKGYRALARAIDSRRPESFVPAWKWSVLGPVMRVAPLSLAQSRF